MKIEKIVKNLKIGDVICGRLGTSKILRIKKIARNPGFVNIYISCGRYDYITYHLNDIVIIQTN